MRDATLDATARLVTEHGLASVTMSKIAAETGVGRATLYKYFPDVEAILVAWHERQIGSHLKHLARVRDQSGDVARRLEAVLEAYALMTYERPHGTELAVLLHRGERQDRSVRDDVAPGELAGYCMHALTAAGRLPSKAAVRRLVTVTLAGLRLHRSGG